MIEVGVEQGVATVLEQFKRQTSRRDQRGVPMDDRVSGQGGEPDPDPRSWFADSGGPGLDLASEDRADRYGRRGRLRDLKDGEQRRHEGSYSSVLGWKNAGTVLKTGRRAAVG